jgi:PERQ amino acid-rich with GYF domain-containing protein
LDGRRIAEEFVRRRKLADKGIVEPATSVAGGATAEAKTGGQGGWSEVAKKGPEKVGAGVGNVGGVGGREEVNPSFKVVPGKKKGKR